MRAADLHPTTLRRMIRDTEAVVGPESSSVRALRRALAEAERRREGEHEQPAGESGEVVGQARSQVRGASGTSARREGGAPAAAGPGEPGPGDGEGVPGMPLTPATGVGYCGPDTMLTGEEDRA